VVQPHAVANDLHREPVTSVQRRRGSHQPRMVHTVTQRPNTPARQPDNALRRITGSLWVTDRRGRWGGIPSVWRSSITRQSGVALDETVHASCGFVPGAGVW
jgi:hypothetical protein